MIWPKLEEKEATRAAITSLFAIVVAACTPAPTALVCDGTFYDILKATPGGFVTNAIYAGVASGSLKIVGDLEYDGSYTITKANEQQIEVEDSAGIFLRGGTLNRLSGAITLQTTGRNGSIQRWFAGVCRRATPLF